MIPAGNEPVDDEVARLIYAEVTRRFDEEDHWRVELESKAGTFLGFLGVFLGILLVYGVTSKPGAAVPLELVAVPTALQVASALLLLRTLYGRDQYAGPSPADVVNAYRTGFASLAMQLASVYAFSIIANRLRHKRALAGYHLAVLFSAAGLVQLAFSTVVEISRQGASSAGWPLGAPYWLPGVLVVVLMARPLRRGYADERRAAGETINSPAIKEESSGEYAGGPEK